MKLTDKEVSQLIGLANELHYAVQSFDDRYVTSEPDAVADKLRDVASEVHTFLVDAVTKVRKQ